MRWLVGFVCLIQFFRIGEGGECFGDTCTTASLLTKGEYISSRNGINKLIMQADGNLVIYCREKAIWSTRTYGQSIKHMAFQANGNIALMKSNNVVAFRSSATSGQGIKLILQNDGNLVIYSSDGKSLWDTRTYGNCPTGYCYHDRCYRYGGLEAMMVPGMTLQSRSGHYTLRFQSDRNLVLYCGDKALWSTKTYGDNKIDKFRFQGDGNLVLFRSDGSVAWAADVSGGNSLVLQNDGNLVVYQDDGNAVWSTNTNGRCPIGNCYEDHCLRNAVLKPGSSIKSKNGLYRFILQQNGKLEILCGECSIWSANGPDKNVKEFIFLTDSNLVVYRNDQSVAWAAGLGGRTPKGWKLFMQNDGNLVMYDGDGKVVWHTATYNKCPAAHCYKDRCVRYNGGPVMMLKGKSLKSPNGKYRFTLQNDGNLVVYCGGKKLWDTGTVSPDIYALYFQSDGNLVLRKKDLSVAWESNAMDSSATRLLVQNDGNVVIYKNNHDAVWSTETYGKCNKAVPISVEYHVDKGEVFQTKPTIVSKPPIENTCPQGQLARCSEKKMTVTVSETKENSKSWEHTAGVEVTVGVEFSAGIPDIASVTKSISVTGSYSHTWGKTETTSFSWSASFECTAKPGTRVVCEIYVIKTKLVVPFTMLWSDGTKTYGKFNGVKYSQGSLNSSTMILSTRK